MNECLKNVGRGKKTCRNKFVLLGALNGQFLRFALLLSPHGAMRRALTHPVRSLSPLVSNGGNDASQTPDLNPLTAKLFNLNFHPLEVVSR